MNILKFILRNFVLGIMAVFVLVVGFIAISLDTFFVWIFTD